MKGHEMRLDRIRGCMIGGAAGDALGWPVEFKSERQIFNRYWPDGIKAYDLNRKGVAEITDDTQMAMFTANALLAGETKERLHGDVDLQSGRESDDTERRCRYAALFLEETE